MNFQDVLHYMFLHSEMLIGIFTALLLFTVIFVLVLPSHDKQNASDLSAIEESLKKVIEQIPKANSASETIKKSSGIQDDEELAYPSSNQDPDPLVASPAQASETSKAEAAEREKKIKSLEAELAQTKAQLLKAPVAAEGGVDPAMAQKLAELQNKLSEYAIIEEELADISRYKDENTKMRAQLEALQAGGTLPAETQPAPQPLDVAPANSEVVAAVETKSEPEVTAPSVAEAVVNEDQVLNDFQAAVNHQAIPKDAIAGEVLTSIPIGEVPQVAPAEAASADASAEISMAEPPDPVPAPETEVQSTANSDSPLEGSLDTSKMLQEMETLVEEPESDESDPMAGLLDTEKLLAEVRELGGPKSPAINPPDQTEVDDLMSEFEAEQKQIKAKA